MPDVFEKYGAKPFQEAVDFFKEKVPLPAEKWDTLWRDQHAKGFMVAGAMKTDLVIDLRAAALKAISGGTTLEDFRKDFDAIVAKHGWVYKGGRNWRTKVIYDTNLRQSYNAGRYKQMSDPDVIALRPYLRYRHGDSRNPRPLHLSWHGLILRHDDPFWAAHKPQNGWGCRCSIDTMSERDLKKLGKSGPDTAPKAEYYDYKNPQTGKMEKVPVGIDPGFDYDPGKAASDDWATRQQKTAWAEEAKAKKEKIWEALTPGDWQSYGRPEKLPMLAPKAAIDYAAAKTEESFHDAVVKAIGGETAIFSFQEGDFRHDILVDAKMLSGHVNPDREPYIPLLKESLESPQEIWMSFEQHKRSGKVVLRHRLIRCIDMGKKKGMLIVTNAVNGRMTAWTVIPKNSWAEINNERHGRLIWAKSEE